MIQRATLTATYFILAILLGVALGAVTTMGAGIIRPPTGMPARYK